MKKGLLTFAMAAAVVSMSLSNANAQTGNVGIGTSAPLNKLHVKPNTVDPIRAEGLQVATDAQVVTTDSNGVLHKRAYPTATNGTGISADGYINSCGCANTATVTARIPVTPGHTNVQATSANPTVHNDSIVKVLANPAVCDVAIRFTNTTKVSLNGATNGFWCSFNLPNPAAYAGRIITWHPELPAQFIVNGGVFSLVSFAPTGQYVGTNAHSEWSGSGVNTSGRASIGYRTNNTSGSDVKMSPTIKTISDGISWMSTNGTSECTVIRP